MPGMSAAHRIPNNSCQRHGTPLSFARSSSTNMEGKAMRDGLNSLLEVSLLGFVVVTCLMMVNPII